MTDTTTRRGRGRPRLAPADALSARITIRLQPAELAELRRLARLAGARTVGNYVRSLLFPAST